MYGASFSNDRDHILLRATQVSVLDFLGFILAFVALILCNRNQRVIAVLLIVCHLVLPGFCVWNIVEAFRQWDGHLVPFGYLGTAAGIRLITPRI
jgi:hypothetical protein